MCVGCGMTAQASSVMNQAGQAKEERAKKRSKTHTAVRQRRKEAGSPCWGRVHAAPPPPPFGRTSMNSRWSSRRFNERLSLVLSASVMRGAGSYLHARACLSLCLAGVLNGAHPESLAEPCKLTKPGLLQPNSLQAAVACGCAP